MREVAWKVLTNIEHMPVWTASTRRAQRLDKDELSVGSHARIEQRDLLPAT